jgi:hypothetical protein
MPNGASRQIIKPKDRRIAATKRHTGTNKARERRRTGRAIAKTAKRILKNVRSAARVTVPPLPLEITGYIRCFNSKGELVYDT